jgi:hypothetical protein
MALVEQVFSGLEQTAQLVQESVPMQPSAILLSESRERRLGRGDLLVLPTPTASDQSAAWLPEDCLAFLGPIARHGDRTVIAVALDDDPSTVETDDLAGLDSAFAGAGRKRTLHTAY